MAALAFGVTTLALQYFVWRPEARWSGIAPALTLGVGLCHAITGAITGPLLVDRTRTNTPARAALFGTATSLIALLLFASLFTAYLFATDIRPVGALSYVVFPLLTALFAFLADGWVLMLISAVVGWALFQLATRQAKAA